LKEKKKGKQILPKSCEMKKSEGKFRKKRREILARKLLCSKRASAQLCHANDWEAF
jgi:hypothetical protein